MKAVLSLATLTLMAPLIWVMSGNGPGAHRFGHSFGVSDAIWLTLGGMAIIVGLCGVILAIDRPHSR